LHPKCHEVKKEAKHSKLETPTYHLRKNEAKHRVGGVVMVETIQGHLKQFVGPIFIYQRPKKNINIWAPKN